MITTEFEEELTGLTDAELLRWAMKYLRHAYMDLQHPGDDEEAQEYLDYVFMECSRRGKEWIFDKAQESCMKNASSFCPVPEEEAVAAT